MGIVTGVIVDHAIQQGNTDRAVRTAKEGEKRTAFLYDMMDLLEAMDLDKNGNISFAEWTDALLNPAISALVTSLGIDRIDVGSIFKLLDTDESGDVSLVELIEAFHRLRGNAKSIDIQLLMVRTNFCIAQVGLLLEEVAAVRLHTASTRQVLLESGGKFCIDPSSMDCGWKCAP